MPVSTQWTVLLQNLLTGVSIGDIPVSGLTFSSVLNNSGSFSGKVLLSDPNVKAALSNLGGYGGLTPGNTAIYIDNGGSLVWGGILWTVSYDQKTRQATLGGKDFWSYFQQRIIAWNPSYTNADQGFIACDLVNSAQIGAGGNIGVTVPSYPVTGQLITVAYSSSQLVTVDSAYTSLATQAGEYGFDHMIDIAYSSTVGSPPVKTLNVSYPRRGRTYTQNNLAFDTSNAYCLGYTWPVDATACANTIYGIGAGSGPTTNESNTGPLRSTQVAGTVIYPTGGYPILEQVLSRSDITQQTILDGVTTSNLYALALPVSLPTVEFSLGMQYPEFGSYLCGDDARFVFQPDEWFPNGADLEYRIVAWTVKVADSGVGSVTLSLQAPPYIP